MFTHKLRNISMTIVMESAAIYVYDLTWSTTYYGEHTTTVNGNGHDPGMKELLAVGKNAGMKQKACKEIAEDVREKTEVLEKTYRRV